MNRTHTALLVAALALPLAASAADKMKTDATGCDNVNWSKEVLDKFPNAKRGCQKVTLKGDVVYVQYKGEVMRNDPDGVTVNLQDHDGKDMIKIKIAPAEDLIKVNDKPTKFKDLEKGTELHFYMPHNRWGLYASPEGTALRVLSSEPL